MDAEQTNSGGCVETVHRSPHSFEVVEPFAGDGRSDPKNIAKRVSGHLAHTRGSSEQLFPNSELANHPVTEAAETDPDRLFATEDNPPNFSIINEKPEHRVIVYLKAQGLSNKEVVDRTGYSQAWVGQICRQPWFRLRLVQELKEAGVDAVQTVIRAAALDSVFTLIDLRDQTSIPPSVRKSACDSLLDRFLGKPTQKIESEERRLPTTPEISALDSQIKDIDRELNPDAV